MKVAPSESKLRKIKHSRVPNKISINSTSRSLQIYSRVTSGRIMRMHLYRAWKHNDSSSVLVCRARPRLLHVTCYIHKEWDFQGLAQPARNFSLFFVRRYGRVSDDWHSLAMFFQGPIGLDGPKGDPVSSPYNLHFNFVALQAKLIAS